jgi:hypothetical protein
MWGNLDEDVKLVELEYQPYKYDSFNLSLDIMP